MIAQVQDEYEEARAAGILIPEPERDPRVVVCMVHDTNYTELGNITVPLGRRYAEKHNYDFVYIPDWDKRYPDLANDGDRFKARMYENLYEQNREHYQWDVYMWIDSDALVMNSQISVGDLFRRLEREQGLGDQHHFLWGEDPSGPNSGVYFARFTWQAKQFMRMQLAASVEMGWGDNTAMIQKSAIAPFNREVLTVPGRYFNSYLLDLYGWQDFQERNGYEEGSFILHLPGLTNARRIPIAREYAAKAV